MARGCEINNQVGPYRKESNVGPVTQVPAVAHRRPARPRGSAAPPARRIASSSTAGSVSRAHRSAHTTASSRAGWAAYARKAWQRGTAGTIEHVNRVLKDELTAGVYPSGTFGANAAWLRLQAVTRNLLELPKAAGLEPELRPARPN